MYFQFFFYQNWSRCTHTTSRATTFKVRLELILILQVRTAILKKELTSILYKSVSIYTCYNHNLLRLLFNEIEAWNMSMNMALYLNDIGPEFPVSCNSGNNVYRRFLSHVFKNNTDTFIFTSNKKLSSRPRKLMSAL